MLELSGSMKRSKRGRRLSASLAPSALKGLIAAQAKPQRRASTLSVLSADTIRKRVGSVLEGAARAKPNSRWHAVRNASNEKLAEMMAALSPPPHLQRLADIMPLPGQYEVQGCRN